ncbi:hypothetical protein BJ508DRAFT_379127 [Ascobolus immersus RN42]|uniref:Trafficking protein particle complex subunit 10 n=1 Tax=Ascobolus immersus RN42 TaxID=1160509 RepID=A0A3N4HYV2_ASCIM|nr:hypothetical protein BJ508DRAFT_379127 [Ascobolus immersus RN42]
MADTPSSKVTVTYWDPSSLFPLIEPQLRSRLPLRNLHWKSPTRPLRSISSLDIELVPFTGYNPPAPLQPSHNPTPSTTELPDVHRIRSSETGGSVSRTSMSPARGATPAPRATRHQIPGLRQTPYLKVFILRCDDNDTYKATSRKQVREWISSHASHTGIPSSHHATGAATIPTATGTTKDAGAATAHDAFEWLIIHVLLPNTPAAQQPRNSSAAATNKSWIKGSQTLLEKLRVDFNPTGKHARDRIVQLRVPHDHPDLSTLSPPVPPPIPNSTPITDPPHEVEAEWSDLITKFKSQILLSFDARVSQYEDDVREKDAMRSLPGWNFCTFFVLKEGLARAFESVGLVEDALAIYDELECGLESVVRDGGVGVGGFEPWTPEIQEWLLLAGTLRKSLLDNSEPIHITGFSDRPLVSSQRKAYREMILGSIISVYDFRTYVFSRQLTLLLRLSASSTIDGSEDLNPLGELCARAILFITSTARVLRRDLWAAWKQLLASPDAEDNGLLRRPVAEKIIDAIVLSWEYAVATQILVETQTATLPKFPPTTQVEPEAAEGEERPKSEEVEGKRPPFPKRTSSLPGTPVDGGFPGPRIGHHLPTQATQQQVQAALKAGLESLASGRGQLLGMVMGVLEKVAVRKGWVGGGGWFGVEKREGGMEEVSLEDKEEKPLPEEPEDGEEDKVVVLLDELLRKECETEGGLCYLFEEASRRAIKHFTLASRHKWAMRTRTQLVAVKFHRGDYAGAAASLDDLIAFYGSQGWDIIETTLLVVQAKCQQQLGHKEEYLKVILRLLAKSAAAEKLKLEVRSGVVGGAVDDEGIDVHGYVGEVETLAREIGEEVEMDLRMFCDAVRVERWPEHAQGRDGYVMELKLWYLLEEAMTVEKVQVRMVDVEGVSRDVVLEAGEVVLKRGECSVRVGTNTTVEGSFTPASIVLKMAKLAFVLPILPPQSALTDLGSVPKKDRSYFYPSASSLQVKLEMPKQIRLDKPRNLELVIKTGRNEISKGELRIKSATAGLRLMTGDLTVDDGVEIKRTVTPGVISIGKLDSEKEYRVGVRFTAENEALDLALKVEVEYETHQGTFLHLAFPKTQMALALAVNVHDIFKANALYSKFAITPSHSGLPLRVLSTQLQENETFACTTGAGVKEQDVVVFSRLPGNFIWRISKKRAFLAARKEEKLGFEVRFRTIREELEWGVERLLSRHLGREGLEAQMPLLLPGVMHALEALDPASLELAALSSGLQTAQLGFPWAETLAGVPTALADRLTPVLKAWLEKYPYLPLPPYEEEEGLEEPPVRSLVIPLDVPTLPLLFSADIKLLPPYDTKPILTTGDALPARVHLAVSTQWANPPPREGVRSGELILPVVTVLGVEGIEEEEEGEERKEEGGAGGEVSLVVPKLGGKEGEKKPVEELAWEVNLVSAAKTVRVCPDVRSTVVAIEGGDS